MMLRLAPALFLMALLLARPVAAKDLLVFGTVNYPPYEIEESKDSLPGIDIEILEYGLTELGHPFEVRFMPWARALAYAEEGTITGVISCGDVPERNSFLALSETTSQLTQALIVHKDYAGVEPKTIDDFRQIDMRYGAVRGYADQKQLKEAQVEHMVLNSTESGLRLLMIKRIDAFWSGMEAIQYIARQMGISDQLRYITLQDRAPYQFHLCVSRKWPGYEKLLNDFNAVLRQMKENGVHQKILDDYR